MTASHCMSYPDPGSARESAGGTGAHAAAAAGFKAGSSFTMAASGASSTSALPVPVHSPSHAAAAAGGLTASTGPAGTASTDALPMYSTSTGDLAAASGSRGTSSAGDPSALRLSSYNPWTPQVCPALPLPAQSQCFRCRSIAFTSPFAAHACHIVTAFASTCCHAEWVHVMKQSSAHAMPAQCSSLAAKAGGPKARMPHVAHARDDMRIR